MSLSVALQMLLMKNVTPKQGVRTPGEVYGER